MKKRYGINKAVPPIAVSELKKLPTKALLGYLERLRHCEEQSDNDDYCEEELLKVQDKILFKNTAIWKEAYQDLKTILATREHIERKRKP